MTWLRKDSVKVLLGLVIGLAVIMYMNPPHTVCDSKKEAYLTELKNYQKKFAKNLGLCRERTDLGGCLPFFEVVEKLLDTLDDVGSQCKGALRDDKLTKQWLGSSMELLTRAAWGSKAPTSPQYKQGWLDVSQLAMFCRLKKNLTDIYSEDSWSEFVNYLLADLPQASTLGRDQAWQRTILSDPCKY